jgi:hypothetical protein
MGSQFDSCQAKPEALGFPQGGRKFAIVAQWVRFGYEPSPI